ncbi:MAG: glycerol kinase GlpK, partial [Firmicutes bacterium]|nr:glycerol kinase GlpK [Bacillota bacterium]
ESYRKIKVLYPQAGWVEHEPEDIWQSVVESLQEISAKVPMAKVAAIGITNQRETVLFWEKKTGRPVTNAISWQCRRSEDICYEWRKAGFEDEVREKTGAPGLDAYFSATKIAWLFRENNELREKAESGEVICGTIDTWLIWNLTAGNSHVTDSSNAVRTILYNFVEKKWDDSLLKKMGIPKKILPNVLPSNGQFGEAVSPASVFAGKPVPIRACLGDQQAALFGHACFSSEVAKCTFGTCLNLGINTGSTIVKSRNGLNPTVAWNIDGEFTYKVEGGVYVAGSLFEWLVTHLGLADSVSGLVEEAKKVKSSEGVYFVPAFVGLGAPHWDMTARGTIAGMSFAHNKGHIARAAVEAVAFQTYDVLRAMEGDMGIWPETLRVDGGVAKDDFVMQILADITGCKIERPVSLDLTTLGAAYMAGLGIGIWLDLDEVASLRQVDRIFIPRLTDSERSILVDKWNRAVERAKNWNNK